MSSARETAEQRFRSAFERLKADEPQLLPRGTPVSQNNVAKEAGTDPTALKKVRYPALIREIQAWVEINGQEKAVQRERQDRRRRARDDLAAKVRKLEDQRDHAQAQLLNAERMVLELLQEKACLQGRLDDLLPPPTPLRK
ncbi:KfrA N-terminal DNA-binding domain-containing protein [Burkholderia pseudomallei]